MQIKIDQSRIDEAINLSATKAIEAAMKSFSVTSAIGDSVTEEIASGAVSEAIRLAVTQVDTKTLTTHLAEEIQKSVTSVVVTILQEGLLDVVCKIRSIGDYSESDKKEKERLRVRLFTLNQGGENP